MNLNTEKQEYKPLIPYDERPPTKRWKSSQKRSKWTDVRLDNELQNSAYMLLITRVKRLYTGRNIQVYERDHRNDSSFNSTTMYSFVTKDLYLEIECDYVDHRCQVLYDFQGCLFEAEIRHWLREYPFSVAAKQQPCTGGVTAYFDRVLTYQGDKHFYFL